MKKEITILLSVILFVIALLVFVPMLCKFGNWVTDLMYYFINKWW
jgi:hypothetical protein